MTAGRLSMELFPSAVPAWPADRNIRPALCAPEATEHSGEVRAFRLICSGNHCVRAERDQYDHLRTVIGIHPEDFRWKLAQLGAAPALA